MSGIFGIWNGDGAPVSNDIFERMSLTLSHRGLDGSFRWAGTGAALGCQLNRSTPGSLQETQPAVGHGGAVLVFDGRLDNRDELVSVLRGACDVNRNSSDTDIVLGAYQNFGDLFAGRLLGDFALVVFHPAERKMLLARDRIGMRPLYYTQQGKSFLFGSEIKTLLAHPAVEAKPNKGALAAFAVRHLPHGRDGATMFEGIRTVRAGHVVKATPEKTSSTLAWDFNTTEILRMRTFDEYAEALRPLLFQAVARRMRSAHPVSISLSGGLDSSTIFCVGNELRKKDPASFPEMYAFSYGTRDKTRSDESEFVNALSERCALPVEFFDSPDFKYGDHADDEVFCCEFPFLTANWELMDRMCATARRHGGRVLLTGEWGDNILGDRAYLLDLARRFSLIKLWRHLEEIPQWNEEAYQPWFRRAFAKQVLEEYVPKWIKDVTRPVRRTAQATCWTEDFIEAAAREAEGSVQKCNGSAHQEMLYQSLDSFTLTNDWYNKLFSRRGVEPAFPFVDRDLVQFAFRVPGDVLNKDGVPRALLRRAMQDILPESVRLRRWKGDFAHLLRPAMKNFYADMQEYTGRNRAMVQHGYVGSRWATDKAGGSSVSDTDTVSMLHVFKAELWLQTFFENKRRETITTQAEKR